MITQQIKRKYCNLTTAERKIATYVIESPKRSYGLDGLSAGRKIRYCILSGDPVL